MKSYNEIILNSIDLNITKIEYQENNSSSSLTGSVEFDEEYEQATIKFNQSIKCNRIYLIKLSFNRIYILAWKWSFTYRI